MEGDYDEAVDCVDDNHAEGFDYGFEASDCDYVDVLTSHCLVLYADICPGHLDGDFYRANGHGSCFDVVRRYDPNDDHHHDLCGHHQP